MDLLGVDTGGTFTDFVVVDGASLRVHKVLSTPAEPEQAILQGIADLKLSLDKLILIHGTTVATNATLEGKGVRCVYIGNKGLKDLLKIGRQARVELYNLLPPQPKTYFEDDLMLEVSARIDAQGNVIEGFTETELAALKSQIQHLAPTSIAINLLFSFLAPAHEKILEALFKDDYFVSRSSKILPEHKEYERGMTTWLNAWIGPLIKSYIERLEAKLTPAPLSIMQSSGLTMSASLAADRAVNLLLSGPAGGLAAAIHLGRQVGEYKIMTFDMGGTSTDVALIDGKISMTNSGQVGPYPVGIPMADIHTIGAGGGSIAAVDEGGLLNVGPESAGANPGPACYNQGGTRPTVSDANLILGRLNENQTLAGELRLSKPAAKQALAGLSTQLCTDVESAALGIIALANEHMSQALRLISIQKGHDPRAFSLMCFGGAGGLHLCDLAESLDMRRAIIPIHTGVFSALGLLCTKPGRELVKTKQMILANINEAFLEPLFLEIEADARHALESEMVYKTCTVRSLDLRYLGQSSTIQIPYTNNITACIALFNQHHKQQYGHRLDTAVEMLNYRVQMTADQEDLNLPTAERFTQENFETTTLVGIKGEVKRTGRPYLQQGITYYGPLLITERHATSYLKPGWTAVLDTMGNLLLERPDGLSK